MAKWKAWDVYFLARGRRVGTEEIRARNSCWKSVPAAAVPTDCEIVSYILRLITG